MPRKAKLLPEIEKYWQHERQEAASVLDVSVRAFTSGAGEALIRLNTHVLALVKSPLTVTVRNDCGPEFDVTWAPGAVGFLPAGTVHWTHIKRPGDFTIVQISDRFFRNAAFDLFDPATVPMRFLPAVEDPVAAHLLDGLRHLALTERTQDFPLLVDWMGNAVSARFLQILSGTETAVTAPANQALSPNRLRRVIDYIEAYIDQRLTLDDLAQVAAMSVYHFSRAFRRATGLSPVRYVWFRRVERAKLMLSGEQRSMSEVWIRCGFSSQSHFTTVFKRMTGVTPGEYRRQTWPGGKALPP